MKSPFEIVYRICYQLFKCMYRRENGGNTSIYIWIILGSYNIAPMSSALPAHASEWSRVNKHNQKAWFLLTCLQGLLAPWQ